MFKCIAKSVKLINGKIKNRRVAEEVNIPKGPDFEIEFGSPLFSLRVGGKSRQECEETFFTVYRKVAKGAIGKKGAGTGMMHQ